LVLQIFFDLFADAVFDPEHHYTQIEKVALAITWACAKFHTNIMGLTFCVELIKHLELLPSHLIHFKLHFGPVSGLHYTFPPTF